jgi:hypothetical protein
MAEQEKRKMDAAQDALQSAMATDPTRIGTREIGDVLTNAEQTLASKAERAPDYQTQKVVEDLSKLVGAAQEVVVEKDLGDRIQRIAKEAELAKREQEGLAKDNTLVGTLTSDKPRRQVRTMANNIVPLLKLVISSYEFRQLVVDFVKVSQRVLLRTTEQADVGSQLESQWLHGRNPAEIAKDVASRTKESVQTEEGKIDIPISDEEVTALTDDFLELLAILARDERYRDGITWLFDIFDTVYDESHSVAQEAKESVQQPHTQKLQEETKDLISQFTGRETLDRFIDNFYNMIDRLRQDQEWRTYFNDLRHFILDTKNPESLQTEEFRQKTRDLAERGRALMDRMRDDHTVDNFFNSANELLDNLKNEEFIGMLRERAGILYQDLTYVDTQGNRQLDTKLLTNIRKFVVPMLADALKYIPIPPIQDSNSKREYIVENIVLCGYDIVPENISVHLVMDSSVNLKEVETERGRTELVISLRNFRTELKDVHFYFKRKVFPELEDSGRVTVQLGGKGATLTMTFQIDYVPEESMTKFTGSKVDMFIDDMDFAFDRSSIKHDILLPMVTSLFKRTIIHGIKRNVEKGLAGLINDLGYSLTKSMAESETRKRFQNQLDWMAGTMKKEDFGRIYQQRVQKLEEKS